MNIYEVINESNRNYICADSAGKEDNFSLKMIMNNKIPGLIDFKIRDFNGKITYYYDVTGKIPFSKMFNNENDTMQMEDVERLIHSFSELIHISREYFLDLGKVNVSADTCFYDPEKKRYEFIYLPEEDVEFDFKKGLKEVWEKVLEKFDHASRMEDLINVYEIYQKTCIGNADISTIFRTKSLSGEGKKDSESGGKTNRERAFTSAKELNSFNGSDIEGKLFKPEYEKFFPDEEKSCCGIKNGYRESGYGMKNVYEEAGCMEEEYFQGRRSPIESDTLLFEKNFRKEPGTKKKNMDPDNRRGDTICLDAGVKKEELMKKIKFILPIIISCCVLIIVIMSMS